MIMALITLTGPIIAASGSLSSGLDCTGGSIVRIAMPDVWTPANLTFQVSTTGSDWTDLFDDDGREVTLTVRPGGSVLASNNTNLRALAFVKFRSGSREFPELCSCLTKAPARPSHWHRAGGF